MTLKNLFGSRSLIPFGLFILCLVWENQAQGQYNLLSQVDGPVAGDKLGWCVAGVGDVSGDGVPDYLAGMPYYDPAGLATAGAARLYSGANGSLLFQKNGSASSEGLGYWVSGAGDVNGDGRADFIVASQSQAFVFSGATGTLLHQKTGGGPVAGVNDVNGDARSDFAVSDLNQTYVYSGATGALLYAKVGGSSVAGLGDVNADGRADFIVGDQYADPGITNAGSAFVYSGANGALLYQKNGAAASDLFGGSVSGLGDINGDGRPDFIVGARLADVSGQVNAGAAYVYSGATGALLYQKTGPAGQQWGQCVGGSGDADGDGRADFMVSSIWTSPGGRTSAGSVFLYSGANGGLLAQFDGQVEYENFGYTLAGLGDINGNGRSDLIVGGPNASPGGRLYAGSGYLFGAGGTVDPCANDLIAPTLACSANKTAGCGQAIVFDQPAASDNCDPAPVVSVVSTTKTPGPGPGDTTHTRTWTARDARGNTSSPCSQSIVASCVQSASHRSQVTPSDATCANFAGETAPDLAEVCYSVKRGKIFSCDPGTFYFYVAVTAPSSSFTVDIVQTRLSNVSPLIAVANRGVKLYDNCTSIGLGSSPSLGQARAQFNGATPGKQYVIAVLYSASSLGGTPVANSNVRLLQRYDFAAQLNGQEITRDVGGITPVPCAVTKISSGPNGVPEALSVGSYPNPFNATANVSFALPEDGLVHVDVYNVIGQRVRELVNDVRTAGVHTVTWNGMDDQGQEVPSGMYFLSVRTRDESAVVKLNLLK